MQSVLSYFSPIPEMASSGPFTLAVRNAATITNGYITAVTINDCIIKGLQLASLLTCVPCTMLSAACGLVIVSKIFHERHIDKNACVVLAGTAVVSGIAGATLGATDCCMAVLTRIVPSSIVQYIPQATSLLEKAALGAALTTTTCAVSFTTAAAWTFALEKTFA